MFRLAALLVLPLLGCSAAERMTGPVAGLGGLAGAAVMASELDYLETQYLAGALIAYAIFDPLAPTWAITATPIDDTRVRFDLRMRALTTGGEGEARHVFERNVRNLVSERGYADYRIVRFEEGIDSARPFARRYASGEVQLIASQSWPSL